MNRVNLRSRFRTLRDKIADRMLPTGVTFGPNRNDRIGALHRAWGYVITNRIEGGYYEFGVYRGETFRASYKICQGYTRWVQNELNSPEQWRQGVAREYAGFQHEFYAFDTFEGMPQNDEGNIAFGQGTFYCTLEEFERLNLIEGIADGERVHSFRGRFEEIQEQQPMELESMQHAAIVNLDCDLYASAKAALAIVAQKLIQGTVLLVDDWNTFAASRNSGERRAITEFLHEHTHITFEPWFPYMYTGQAFLVHMAHENIHRTSTNEDSLATLVDAATANDTGVDDNA